MVPKLQRVEVGDIFPWMSTADDDFVVKAVDPEHALALGGEAGSRYSITWRQSATGMLPPLPHLSELAEPVGGGHSAVHQDVAAGDKAAVRAQEQRTHRGHVVGSTAVIRVALDLVGYSVG